VRIYSRFTGITTYQYTTLAESDWAHFGLSALVESTPTTTVGDEMANNQARAISPSSNESFTLSDRPTALPNRSNSTLNQPDTTQPDVTLNQPNTAQSDITLNDPDIAPNQLDTPLAQPSHINDQPGASDTSVVILQPGISCSPATATTMLPSVNPSPSHFISDSTRLPPLPIGEPQPAAPSQPYLEANARLLDSLPSGEATPHLSAIPPFNILIGITNEPTWMKKKRTLDYFRNTIKLGDLPNIIEHWYELEELLGFPDTVSVFI